MLLATALLAKMPTFVRAWRDVDVRATTILLACATAVLVVITPANIHRLNVWTGIPNVAAPWAYSFLTAFCATSMTMIMRWREPPSKRRDRRMRAIYLIYACIIAALWITFFLADVPEPRIYDLDTYYATTLWMREHTLLYVVTHMVSSLTAAYMLWKWFPQVTNRWLKTGVVFLQLGFLSGLFFDAAKYAAVTARWTGHDLDFMSTEVAPPFALLQSILVALGFLVPQAGPFLHQWGRDQRDYARLNLLWRTVRVIEPAAAEARVGWRAPVDLRLIQRRQRIHDALRLLAPYFDVAAYDLAHRAAAAEHDASQARGLAGALAIQAAVDDYCCQRPHHTKTQPPQIGPDVTNHIDDIAQALGQTRALDRIRQQTISTEGASRHV
ncbi:MAB_1171c family putative transporter [Streptomyces sp. NPDC005496]|uniref:MAB_1171c family putative transporter n=1 Tax=Streptomyces sp. NPDC005496 TaxID=3364716 RepID=UPI0036BA73BE